MTDRGRSLPERFGEVLVRDAGLKRGDRVVVAVSGGLDSCVLLHLVRFASPEPLDAVVAHFDHAMRPESAADAAWVRGLSSAWGVPCRCERAGVAPSSEDAARRARYDALERVRADVDARAVLVGHHADDQAETVLFRVLRGTGPAGLAAIPRRRDPAVYRPLLGFWREELEAYAMRVRLGWRDDASNDELTFARNAIRHRLIPDAERLVAPGARRALVRLARVAADDEAAWRGILEGILSEVDLEEVEGGVAFGRDACRSLHPGVRRRVVRTLTRRVGVSLDETGTRLAVEFISRGRSGGGIDLGGGVELRRELDRILLRRVSAPGPDRTLSISDPSPGTGDVMLGGKTIRVRWGGEDPNAGRGGRRLDLPADRCPLLVRAREPGDRIRLPGGTKKLKKVFLEARIPPDRRRQVPVVVDADGEVLWVAGVARSSQCGAPTGTRMLTIEIG